MSRAKKIEGDSGDYGRQEDERHILASARKEIEELTGEKALLGQENRILDSQCDVLRQTLIAIASSLPDWRKCGIQAKVAEIQAIIRTALVRDAIATVDGAFVAKPICFVPPLAAEAKEDLGGDVHQAEAE
jgi:hypothetical protein